MANQFLNAVEYANVMLLLLKNQLVTGKLVDGQFKDEVTDENGLTINVKRPPRFVRNNAAAQDASLSAQDVVTGAVPVAVNQYGKVHISIGDIEYVASYNALMKNETMKSAASTLAHQVDAYLQSQILGFHSWVAGNATTGGVNASDPTKPFATSSQAMSIETRLLNQGCPLNDTAATVIPLDGELIRGSQQALFTPDINVDMLKKVKIPTISTVDFYSTQQCPALKTGTRTQGDGSTTGAQVTNAGSNVNYRDVKTSNPYGQTLAITGGGANATIAVGEVFTIQNVYAWDWRNQVALDYLQQFTVTAAATLSGGGAATISISPPIIVQGTADATGNTNANTAFATVDSIPAQNAYIKWAGAASTNLRVRAAWQKRAIALVSARLQMPFTGVASFATDPDTGIAIRYWRGSDIMTGQHIHRWDMIYGANMMDQFLGTRGCGS